MQTLIPSPCKAMCIPHLSEVDFTDADVILSDNIINLTDDKPRVISFTTEDIINGNFTDATDVKNRLRIRSLRDTY